MVNIIQNPGFENGTTNWELYYGATRIYDSSISSYVIQLNPGSYIRQDITLPGNVDYKLSFRVRTTESAIVNTAVGGDNNTFVMNYNSYTILTHQDITAGANYIAIKNASSNSTIYIDDVILELVSQLLSYIDVHLMADTPVPLYAGKSAHVEFSAYDQNNQSMNGVSISWSLSPSDLGNWEGGITNGVTYSNGSVSLYLQLIKSGNATITAISGNVTETLDISILSCSTPNSNYNVTVI